MKSLLLFLLAMMFYSSVIAGDRTVFIERYTSSTCGPCASNNPALDNWLSTQDPYKVMGIAYHMSWPAPGTDPMYHHNTSDNEARRNYYGINAIPQGRFEGTTSLNSPYSSGLFQSLYDSRINVLSPLTILMTTQNIGADSVEVTVKVYCETAMENPNVVLQIAVLEHIIQYPSPPGTNGEMVFHDVMRKMLPNATGTPMTLTPGQMVTVKQKYWKNPVWNQSEIRVISFVQRNDTKEIIQSGQKTENFTLLPNPGFKVVNQGQTGSGTFQISTPVIADGYNSPVTFTATVEPSNAGITTSFPGGNVLSNFTQSIALQVNSNASVPAGVYKVIVTGTNGQGKSHKTVVNYLVGKNYVSVGTNKGNLSFKVNGTTYSTPQLFTWDINSAQTIEAVTPQVSGNSQNVFVNWSTGQTTPVLNLNINAEQSQYTANFKTQYKVIALLNPAGIPVTVTNGNMFHDSGSAVNINVTPYSVQFNGRTYWFQRWQGAGNGSYTGTSASFTLSNLSNAVNQIVYYDTINTGISSIGSEIPNVYKLYQNYPNPFNPTTNIKFDIPQQGFVTLKIYDMLGKEVALLSNQVLQAGRYEANWNASGMPSGVYFYKLVTPAYSEIKRMVLIK
ncbi:MAG TPA: T9SS type A sorting domain-containing protein [Ignavibacteria bacterium]|nr:T9SS type A sorting domain-containing protein [Ignavibacteria bacterium]